MNAVSVSRATLTVDLRKIENNTRRVVEVLQGIDVVGVTKVTGGSPEVAAAMLDGGVMAIGESRLENAASLRDAGIEAPLWLLRAPTPDLAADAVRLTDVSLASEVGSLEALDRACAEHDREHGVVAMVDLGDLREGMMPDELPDFIEQAIALPWLELLGVGTSLTCYGGVAPDEENLGELISLANAATEHAGRPMLVSGGMSSSIELAVAGQMPAGIGNLRIGETILLGVSTLTRKPILGLHLDAFTLQAPVIECKLKPSAPRGTLAQDAFGNTPVFEDRGQRMRALCALGRQDAPPGGIAPFDPGVRVLGASSDHLILDVGDAEHVPTVGETVGFVPNYAATLRLFTSPFVDVEYVV